jgi:hypothetical protein
MTQVTFGEYLLMFLCSVPPAWVLIFRPAWANKLVGRYVRITATRGKVIGALVLVSFVYNLGWAMLFGPTATPLNGWLFRQIGTWVGQP